MGRKKIEKSLCIIFPLYYEREWRNTAQVTKYSSVEYGVNFALYM